MKNKNILIIGGTGSWAKSLIPELLKEAVAQIRVFARSESEIVALKQLYSDVRIIPFIGDIRDKDRLTEACSECHYIFHLAALKHVPICESVPTEAILTNVIGTQNIIECASAAGVLKLIYVSTDKAVAPACTYGCTKLLGEKLILSASKNVKGTKFMVFRGGNLLGSSGSVVQVFKTQIKKKGFVTLTDKKMNRFFISLTEASKLLIDALLCGTGGEIFLPAMPSLSIYNIAKYLLAQNGFDDSKIRITGLRPGEKISEDLLTEEEAKHIYHVSDNLYMIKRSESHAFIVNGFVEKSAHYAFNSQDAIVDYDTTTGFLKAAHI